MDSKNLPNRLRELRKANKISQKALGEKIGLSMQSINDIESGRRSTTADKLILIADFFSISLDYLLGRTDIKDMAQNSTETPTALTPEEQLLLENYRKLDNVSKGRLIERSEIFLEEFGQTLIHKKA